MASIYDIPAWEQSVSYNINDIVIKNGKYHYNILAGQNSTFDTSNFGGYFTKNGIELPCFLWTPSYGSPASCKPLIKSISFGDNYEQRFKNVINNSFIEFNLVFDKRNDAESRAILHFLKNRKKKEKFFWTAPQPFSEPRVYICEEWSFTRNFFDNNTIQAKFTERPYLLTLTPSLPPVEPVFELYNKLIAHWKLDETVSLSQRLDSVGNNYLIPNNATQSYSFNLPTLPRNLIRGCFLIGGFSSYLQSNNGPVDDILSMGDFDRTFSGWFSQSPVAGGDIIFGQDSQSDRGYWLTLTNSNTITWNVYDDTNTLHTVVVNIPELPFESQIMIFFSCGYNKSRKRIFLTLRYSKTSYVFLASEGGTVLTTPKITSANFSIGARENVSDRGYLENGVIASFTVWDRLLTNDEMNLMYNKELSTIYPLGRPYPFYPI